jgi:uncharacterized lipoprotein YajG
MSIQRTIAPAALALLLASCAGTPSASTVVTPAASPAIAPQSPAITPVGGSAATVARDGDDVILMMGDTSDETLRRLLEDWPA